MKYTEEDIEMAKESISAVMEQPIGSRVGVLPEAYQALIDRLYAAELYVEAHRNGRPPVALEELAERWRKACGK